MGGLYAARVGHVSVAGPMETVANPVMQDYFERTRRKPGRGRVPHQRCRDRDEGDAWRAGLGVGLVADRVIGGSGTRVELFGGQRRIPAGPAMLAVESGARLCFISLRREDRPGRWIGSIEVVAVPRRRDPPRADRGHSARPCTVDRAHVATAPEQWWTLLFPVWEDIRERRHARRAGPRGPARPHAGLGRRLGRGGDPGVRRGERPGRGGHHRPRADRCGRGGPAHRPGARPAARDHRGRGDHHPQRPPGRAVPHRAHQALGVHEGRRGARPRPGWHRDRGPPAGALSAVRLGGHHPQAAGRRGRATPPGRDRGVQPHDGADALVTARAGLRGGDGRGAGGGVRCASGGADREGADALPGERQTICARRSRRARPPGRERATPGRTSWACSASRPRRISARSGTRCAARSGATAGRDLGYPGGTQRPVRFDARAAGIPEEEGA